MRYGMRLLAWWLKHPGMPQSDRDVFWHFHQKACVQILTGAAARGQASPLLWWRLQIIFCRSDEEAKILIKKREELGNFLKQWEKKEVSAVYFCSIQLKKLTAMHFLCICKGTKHTSEKQCLRVGIPGQLSLRIGGDWFQNPSRYQISGMLRSLLWKVVLFAYNLCTSSCTHLVISRLLIIPTAM